MGGIVSKLVSSNYQRTVYESFLLCVGTMDVSFFFVLVASVRVGICWQGALSIFKTSLSPRPLMARKLLIPSEFWSQEKRRSTIFNGPIVVIKWGLYQSSQKSEAARIGILRHYLHIQDM